MQNTSFLVSDRLLLSLLSAGALGMVLLVGCTTIPLLKEVAHLRNGGHEAGWEPVGPMEVKAESSGLTFNEKEQEVARTELLERIEGLVSQERYASARAWVRRFPDVALDLLRSEQIDAAPAESMDWIASSYDELGLSRNSVKGWSDVIGHRRAGQPQYETYFAARRELLTQLRKGQFRRASESTLPTAARPLGPLVQIDAWSLTGLAHLLNDQPHQAAENLQRGIELAERYAPHQAAQMLLLLSDAQRRGGETSQSVHSWQRGVLLGAELLEAPVPVRDPQFWEQAGYLRPAHQRWPQGVERQLLRSSGLIAEVPADGTLDETLAEVALWACLGRWRLERDEADAALVAFKRAETTTPDPHLQMQLRLAQAEAMFRLEQVGAATAILVSVSKQEDPVLSARAMALLGSIKLQTGHTQMGFNLLYKALEGEVEWPGRAQAEADLGLAYLMNEEESAGLRWLHSAQRRFQRQGDLDLLAKSLFNEAEYFKAKKQTDRSEELTRRRLELERQGAAAR
jgi:hypothetical protein